MSSPEGESGDLLDEFLQTADERLERITVSWLTFERDPTSRPALDLILRELHTLKGEAKMMGFSQVSLRAHQIETLLAEKIEPSELAARGDVVLHALDAVRVALRRHGKNESSGLSEDIEQALLLDVSGGLGASRAPSTSMGQPSPPVAEPASPPPSEATEGVPVAPAGAPARDPSARSSSSINPMAAGLASPALPAPAPTSPKPRAALPREPSPEPVSVSTARAALSSPLPGVSPGREGAPEPLTTFFDPEGVDILPKTLRVDSERIAKVARITAESAIGQASIDHTVDGIIRLSQDAGETVRRIERAQALGIAHRATRTSDAAALDALRTFATRLAQMSKTIRDQSHQAGLRVKELDWRARELRMVPIRGVLERHVRLVRDLSRELKKRAVLSIQDSNVSIDKAVVERIADPLIHLVRNAIDHGIESPQERLTRGKAEEARLTLAATHEGGFVRITLSDDGRGVDLDLVRRRAVDLHLVTPQTVVSDEDALAFLFKPGFSTRTVATETSGRGVGLDVVRHEVELLGGTVHVESLVGVGTRFELRVPSTISLTRVLVLDCGGSLYSIPSATVGRLVEVKSVVQVGNQPTVETPDGLVRLAHLSQVLGLPHHPEHDTKGVVVRHDNLAVALSVSGYEDELELVAQPLGVLLRSQRLISGASILPNGRLTLVLNPAELVSRALGEAPRVTPRRDVKKKDTPARILVVEDSAITRAVVTRILRALDYDVWEASDGQDALALLAGKVPDLVLTDIDMPIIGGIELIRRMRANSALARLPVIVLSTRGSDEDKRNALSVGADAYLVKTEFSEGALKSVVSRQLGSAA